MTAQSPLIFRPERHEALGGDPWTEAAARDAIRRIVDATCAAFDPASLWPVHPGDREPGDAPLPTASIYCGAAGVLWALRRLSDDDVADVHGIDLDAATESLLPFARGYNEASGVAASSYWLGETGVLLLQWKRGRDPATEDALFELCEGNLDNPALEALWGSPGTMVAAIHVIEALDDPARRQRWTDLLQRGARTLFDRMHSVHHSLRPEEECWLWTQDLYGKRYDHLGAGHGYAGNVYPILRGASWIDSSLVERFEQRAARVFETAKAERDGLVNWEPVFDPRASAWPERPLMQDCHGAPGIVCRLAGTRSEALRRLLVQGGEAIWAAGPLRKSPGLCHGTDGNGYAFLKLHAMTGETRWLERARAFAMHAVRQSETAAEAHGDRRYSLWTGDLGLAVYLSSCLRADPSLPTLDVF